MKHMILVILFLALLAGGVWRVAGSPMVLTAPRWSVEGSVGSSSSGSMALTGTSGQTEAGVVSGGSYTLRGGFQGGAILPATVEIHLYLPVLITQ